LTKRILKRIIKKKKRNEKGKKNHVFKLQKKKAIGEDTVAIHSVL
jgi:hypothetical protein